MEQRACDGKLNASSRVELRAKEWPELLGALKKLIGEIQALVLPKRALGKAFPVRVSIEKKRILDQSRFSRIQKVGRCRWLGEYRTFVIKTGTE